MDENALHAWMLQAFGPVQGEQAWEQFQELPDAVKAQLLANSADGLPDPAQLQGFMSALGAMGGGAAPRGGMGFAAPDVRSMLEGGPIIVDMATAMAEGKIAAENSERVVTAADADMARRAVSEANLWLDSTVAFNPAPGAMQVWTRAQWADKTIPGWAKIATPVAGHLCSSLADVIQERLGDQFSGQVTGVFAGPVPIPMPEDLNDPGTVLKLAGSMALTVQLGSVAGDMALEERSAYEQGLPISPNPAGAIVMQNAKKYAKDLGFDLEETLEFLALVEAAHARLYAASPWLPSRFETLIYKYSRSIRVDLDSMEDRLRDAEGVDPGSLSAAVNLSNVAAEDTPEQREVLDAIEDLLALVEGWVDCVVWRAGIAHIPHLGQLLEMRRRERATGGKAEQTLESLIGVHVHPRKMRQAADIWNQLTAGGVEERDGHWRHPDLLPQLPDDEDAGAPQGDAASPAGETADSAGEAGEKGDSIDWDAELDQLLSGQDGEAPDDPADS